jgi:hypothetical protein
MEYIRLLFRHLSEVGDAVNNVKEDGGDKCRNQLHQTTIELDY